MRNQDGAPLAHTGYKISEIFGCNTFSGHLMSERLPGAVYRQLMETIETGARLSEEVANVVAHAMKEWALENGATHYCHWFQPMTGLTAEKHDSFLDLDARGRAIERFSGRNLIQGEPDASSFPSGGLRTTFEARGYTGWDPSSPTFLMSGPFASTLCIPTVFTTFHGEAMDKKTPLLRSLRNLSQAARRLLALFAGTSLESLPCKFVNATIGSEQEYFLVDREHWRLRPDLIQAGRTLLGAPPAKGQQLEDHYFGSITDRVQAYMQEIELELYKVGVPAKTRHNEVAPSQFEMAPIFETANIAADHNFLTMEIMKRVAIRHGLAVLLHEKPFAGINGSGKHCNWSMSDDAGNNLLEPGKSPEANLKFLAFLCATVEGVHRRADLLRASIATSGNDHRLGANEAPPAIISVFLGNRLSKVLDSIAAGTALDELPQKIFDLGLTQLPGIVADNTDRNRTSPFAFTGNKFEFRAVGASSPISTPVAYLNAAVSESINLLCDRIEKYRPECADFGAALMRALTDSINASRPVRFEGNNYSHEWVLEAERRGLPNLRHTPEALEVLHQEKTIAFLEKEGILSRLELEARYNAQVHRFLNDIDIEIEVLDNIARTMVLPAALEYERELASTIVKCKGLVADETMAPQTVLLTKLARTIAELLTAAEVLDTGTREARSMSDHAARATCYAKKLRPGLEALRSACDSLERQLPADRWPLPSYREMLFAV